MIEFIVENLEAIVYIALAVYSLFCIIVFFLDNWLSHWIEHPTAYERYENPISFSDRIASFLMRKHFLNWSEYFATTGIGIVIFIIIPGALLLLIVL